MKIIRPESGQKKPMNPLDFIKDTKKREEWEKRISIIKNQIESHEGDNKNQIDSCERTRKSLLLIVGKEASALLRELKELPGKIPKGGKFIKDHFGRSRNRIDEAIAANRAVCHGASEKLSLTELILIGQKLASPDLKDKIQEIVKSKTIESVDGKVLTLGQDQPMAVVKAIKNIGKPRLTAEEGVHQRLLKVEIKLGEAILAVEALLGKIRGQIKGKNATEELSRVLGDISNLAQKMSERLVGPQASNQGPSVTVATPNQASQLH